MKTLSELKRRPSVVIAGLDEVVRHLVDCADREELSDKQFTELNTYIQQAIRVLEAMDGTRREAVQS